MSNPLSTVGAVVEVDSDIAVTVCHGLTPARSQAPCSHSFTPPPAGLGRELEGKRKETHVLIEKAF